MREFGEKLKATVNEVSAEVTCGLQDVDTSKIIDPENEDHDSFAEFVTVIDEATQKHVNDRPNIEVTADQYVSMELAWSHGGDGKIMHANVKKRVRDEEKKPLWAEQPKATTRLEKNYEVEYIDRRTEELTANIFLENLIAQVDDQRILPNSVPQSQGTCKNRYGVKRRKITTRGREILVVWKDGSTDWIL